MTFNYFIGSHSDIDNYASQMILYSGSDYTLIDDYPSNKGFEDTVAIDNSVILGEDSTSNKYGVSGLNIEIVTQNFTNLDPSTFYSKSINLTCYISTAVSISHTIQPNGSNLVPSWVDLDLPNKLLNFTTPFVTKTTKYTFKIISAENFNIYEQVVYLEIIIPEKEEEYVMPLALKATNTAVLTVAGVGTVSAFSDSILASSSLGVCSLSGGIEFKKGFSIKFYYYIVKKKYYVH
jgi:hypothetical protein